MISKKELEALIQEHITDNAVSKILGITRAGVCYLRRKYGIPSVLKEQRKKARDKINRYVKTDMTIAEIARRVNMSPSSVGKYVFNICGHHRNSRPITKRDEREIIRHYKMGWTYFQIQSLGYTNNQVRGVQFRNRLRKTKPFGVSKERLKRLYQSLESDYEVGKIIGKPQFLVFYWRRRYGIPTLNRKKRRLRSWYVYRVHCKCREYILTRFRPIQKEQGLICSYCKTRVSNRRLKLLGHGRFESEEKAFQYFNIKPS